MGRRMMGWLAAAAAGLAAPVAWGQPEFFRVDPGVHIHAGPWIAAEGDLLAWTGSPDEREPLQTQILRRTETGWQREATFLTENRWQDYGALTVVSGDRVAMRASGAGLRIWRHEGGAWIEERLDRNNLLWGEAVAIDGPWLAMPLRQWGMWNLPLVVVYHFDGEVWRLHSHLEAPTDLLPLWVAIEDDLMAVQLRTRDVAPEPAPLVLFRLEGDRWRYEQTLPVESWWASINEGRIAVTKGGGLTIYAESAPGVWEVDSSVPEVGPFVLDGDTLVAIEPVVPAEWDFRGRAAVFHRTDTGWERDRVLYPSNAFSLEAAPPHLPFALSNYGPIAWAGGEIFAVTVEGEWGWFDAWRIVGFPACRADFNGDGVADFADLLAFLEGRERGMLSADYDMDGMIGDPWYWDEGDFLEFMRVLEEGC